MSNNSNCWMSERFSSKLIFVSSTHTHDGSKEEKHFHKQNGKPFFLYFRIYSLCCFSFQIHENEGGRKCVLEIFIFPTRARDKGTNRVEILFSSLLYSPRRFCYCLFHLSTLNMQRLHMLKAFSVSMTWECGQLVWCWWDGEGVRVYEKGEQPFSATMNSMNSIRWFGVHKRKVAFWVLGALSKQ